MARFNEFVHEADESNLVCTLIVHDVPQELTPAHCATPKKSQGTPLRVLWHCPSRFDSRFATHVWHSIYHGLDLWHYFTKPSHHHVNPTEHTELKCQVDDLLSKGFIQESLSPCAVPALLLPKKDNSWHMCIDCRAINCIMVKYRFPMPWLNNMLDLISSSS